MFQFIPCFMNEIDTCQQILALSFSYMIKRQTNAIMYAKVICQSKRMHSSAKLIVDVVIVLVVVIVVVFVVTFVVLSTDYIPESLRIGVRTVPSHSPEKSTSRTTSGEGAGFYLFLTVCRLSTSPSLCCSSVVSFVSLPFAHITTQTQTLITVTQRICNA